MQLQALSCSMQLCQSWPTNCCLHRQHTSNSKQRLFSFGQASWLPIQGRSGHIPGCRQRLAVLAAASTGSTQDVTDWQQSAAERAALEAFCASLSAGADARGQAIALLREAARTRRVAAQRVVGALALLEQQPTPPGVAEALEAGRWKLVFSAPASLPALAYIPVEEDLTIDPANKLLGLESVLGPVHTRFEGGYAWRPAPAAGAMDFSFTRALVTGFGRTLLDKQVSFSRKTYRYFLVEDGLACARSSGGGLTLMLCRA